MTIKSIPIKLRFRHGDLYGDVKSSIYRAQDRPIYDVYDYSDGIHVDRESLNYLVGPSIMHVSKDEIYMSLMKMLGKI